MSETGIVFEYEQQAMNGAEMPDGLDYADQIMFQQLRLLYKSVRNGVIPRDVGIQEKKKFMREYERNKRGIKAMNYYINYISDTQQARIDYNKNKTLENADKIVKAIEGRTTSEYSC